ncbi:MAG: class SAM-dependent methyltransferase [Frankiales bacterium]|nr:class SAM-dependent methyltransferase [Frankiales bacterium]
MTQLPQDRHRLALALAVLAGAAGVVVSAVASPETALVVVTTLVAACLVAVVGYGGLLVRQARSIRRLVAKLPTEPPTPDALTGAVFTRRLEALAKSDDRRQRELTNTVKQTSVDVGALLNLHKVLGVDREVPPAGGWAAQPEVLLALVSLVLERRPAVVLELGSGASTVWLARALRETGGRLVSFEHDVTYADATLAALRRNGLQDIVDLRVAPLADVPIDGVVHRWYDPAALAEISGVGLLFVDGPPGSTGPLARYPALPLLRDRLLDGGVVGLDDYPREEEQEIAGRWAAELAPDFDLRPLRLVSRTMFWELGKRST